MAGLDTGELPVTGFTHTSVVDGIVESTERAMPLMESVADVYAWLANDHFAEREAWSSVGVELGTSGPIAVETTYTLQPADPAYVSGWHANDGPVILTVTNGTLTLVDDTCRIFDLVAGHTHVESTGQVLNALVLPEKNPGVEEVAWFTTRLSAEGAGDPVEMDAPCTM
jgi:hypothetical protein